MLLRNLDCDGTQLHALLPPLAACELLVKYILVQYYYKSDLPVAPVTMHTSIETGSGHLGYVLSRSSGSDPGILQGYISYNSSRLMGVAL